MVCRVIGSLGLGELPRVKGPAACPSDPSHQLPLSVRDPPRVFFFVLYPSVVVYQVHLLYKSVSLHKPITRDFVTTSKPS